MSHYILDKAYATETGDLRAYLAVVQGQGAHWCRLPGKEGGTLLGATLHSQDRVGGHVAVRKAGIARVEAGGAIAVGQPVKVDEHGRVVGMAPWKIRREPPWNGPEAVVQAEAREGTDERFTGSFVECLGYAETEAKRTGDIVEVFISMHQRLE